MARIEEADKRTFATIAQYSHQVPVFVVGTKKDKLMGYRKMQLLEEIMEETGNYKEAKRQAEEKASTIAEAQFAELRNQLSQIEHYKADGFCCLSKGIPFSNTRPLPVSNTSQMTMQVSRISFPKLSDSSPTNAYVSSVLPLK